MLATWGCAPPARSPTPPAPAVPRPSRSAAPVATKVRPVLLVQATSSAPNDRERKYSASVTSRIAKWLAGAGVPAKIIDDVALTRGAWSDASVVVLCYNPNPGMLELLALSRFIKRNGKIIVFYSAEPRLASLMGMRLGPYTPASDPGQWSAFRFTDVAPAAVPALVEQSSSNIRPAYPAGTRSKVIAWWLSAAGKRSSMPAWTSSEQGYWMSHVLLEGDPENKTRMLVALLGACDPAIWRTAASHALETAGTMGRYPDREAALNAVQKMAQRSGQVNRIDALLSQCRRLENELVDAYRRGDYDDVLASARVLDRTVTEAYAQTQTPAIGEFRGVWNHSGLGLYPGNWDETCRVLAQSGLTAVFPHVGRPWSVHYRSALVPLSDAARQHGDQLRQCTEAARRHGLEIHAWVICWNLEGAAEPVITAYRKQGRLQVSAEGATLPWLCPSNPENLTFEVEIIRDMVTRYKPDGVHLDYIRFKSQDYCYCSGCRARFNNATGLTVRRWPADVRTGPLGPAWRQWRRDQITALVIGTQRMLRSAAPGTRLSAAVYTGYPGCRDSIGQDWAEWIRLGYLDFACPMNYTEDTRKFTDWCRKQIALPGMVGRLYPGIGVTAAESRLNAVGTIEQINVLRYEGAKGFMLFDANRTLEREILPYLKIGLTSDRRT